MRVRAEASNPAAFPAAVVFPNPADPGKAAAGDDRTQLWIGCGLAARFFYLVQLRMAGRCKAVFGGRSLNENAYTETYQHVSQAESDYAYRVDT
jgi:hypothetical protein